MIEISNLGFLGEEVQGQRQTMRSQGGLRDRCRLSGDPSRVTCHVSHLSVPRRKPLHSFISGL